MVDVEHAAYRPAALDSEVEWIELAVTVTGHAGRIQIAELEGHHLGRGIVVHYRNVIRKVIQGAGRRTVDDGSQIVGNGQDVALGFVGDVAILHLVADLDAVDDHDPHLARDPLGGEV